MKRFTNSAKRMGANAAGQGLAMYAGTMLQKKKDGSDLVKPKALFAIMSLVGLAGAAYSKNEMVQDFALGFGGQALVREGVEFLDGDGKKLSTGMGLAGVDGMPDTDNAEDVAYWQEMYNQSLAENAAMQQVLNTDNGGDGGAKTPAKTGKKTANTPGI